MFFYFQFDILISKDGDFMVTEAQKRAVARYDKENTQQILLKLNKVTDADILDRLHSVRNKQGYIKRLIRQDINKTEV